ncbi:hypothetical protein Y1Q_0014513 [Alligator mississippiensis]|uniref:Uncharacterized protein n=1 Tax=Alligator mississippiensis TaxID=8496 RepID=A0A151PD90_ALLMI|nr:hypothetical protein Y1Q_0014513 [Alligator mississippiensis]
MAAELPLQLWQETADQSAVLLKQSFSSADVQPIHRGRQGTSNKTSFYMGALGCFSFVEPCVRGILLQI